VSHRFETASLAAEAGLFTWLALGATVAIDTLHIITVQPESTGGHTGNGGQDVQFLAGQFAIMVVIAVLFVGTFAEQKVIVAQFELLQAIKVIPGDALEIKSIHTLAVLISFHGLGRS
jgi:hypothetical protein